VFIDGANFYNACRENLGGRTDVSFGSFAAFLVGSGRSLVRTYYYACALPPDHDPDARKSQQRFFTALQHVPYTELRYGKLVKRDVECPACNDRRARYQEKGVDMRIGVDMLAGASTNLYDVGILVSGDGDLVEAVRAVKNLGKHVELATFAKGRSFELASAADVITELTMADMRPLLLR
jgi:uncharacterized LabA/DUF88 family protein